MGAVMRPSTSAHETGRGARRGQGGREGCNIRAVRRRGCDRLSLLSCVCVCVSCVSLVAFVCIACWRPCAGTHRTAARHLLCALAALPSSSQGGDNLFRFSFSLFVLPLHECCGARSWFVRPAMCSTGGSLFEGVPFSIFEVFLSLFFRTIFIPRLD